MSKMICYCKNVTIDEVERAVVNGAKTLGEIQATTGACTGNKCKELNPLGRCCSEDINAILNDNTSKSNSHCCCT